MNMPGFAAQNSLSGTHGEYRFASNPDCFVSSTIQPAFDLTRDAPGPACVWRCGLEYDPTTGRRQYACHRLCILPPYFRG
jgi:hypothetical protein